MLNDFLGVVKRLLKERRRMTLQKDEVIGVCYSLAASQDPDLYIATRGSQTIQKTCVVYRVPATGS